MDLNVFVCVYVDLLTIHLVWDMMLPLLLAAVSDVCEFLCVKSNEEDSMLIAILEQGTGWR